MTRKGLLLFIFLILFSLSFSAITPFNEIQTKADNLSVEDNLDTSLKYYIPTDFSWNPLKLSSLGSLSDTTTQGSFEYSISDSLIYIHELDTYICNYGVYATVPVTNGHLAYSCETRTTTGHVYVRRGFIRLYDPVTNESINNVPQLMNSEDGELDSGYHYFGTNISLSSYDEVIMFIFIWDGYSADWGLECFIKNLRIYTDDFMPLKDSLHAPIPLTYYDWSFGTFVRPPGVADLSPPLTPVDGGEFNYSVNQTHLYVEETGSGTDDSLVGGYARIPVNQDTIKIAFDARYACLAGYMPLMQIKIYHPTTLARIYPHPNLSFVGSPIYTDIGYHYYEFDFNLPGYDEVLLFFHYYDRDPGNQQVKFWITNLQLEYPIEYDDQSPLIVGPDDFIIETGSTGNLLNWTLADENPDYYEIYRNDVLLDSDTWESFETVSINIDYLADGIYNYTIVAYDIYGNYARDTVVVTVIAYFESSYPFATLAILVLGISIIFTVTRRKKKEFR